MKPGREVFYSSGETEDKASVEERDEQSRLRRIEKTERDPQLDAFLENVDFNLLKDIYAKVAEKSGIDPDTLNFLGKERISPDSGFLAIGSYNILDNVIGISYRKVDNLSRNDERIDLRTLMLEVLCHEETHASAKTVCIGMNQPLSESKIHKHQAGYASSEKTYDKSRIPVHQEADHFFLFNEAVTEKFAREVFSEYARAVNYVDEKKISALEAVWKDNPEALFYSQEIALLDALIAKISRETGIGEKLVWRSIVRGAFEGENFKDPELVKLFSEIIGPDFLEKLSKKEHITALTESLAPLEPDKKENVRKKIIEWLDPLLRKVSKKYRYSKS